MPMCIKCGNENHDSLEQCLYCGADLTLTTIEEMEHMNLELFKNIENRQRIIEDQLEKAFKTKLKFVF